jgi:hypothetical protein
LHSNRARLDRLAGRGWRLLVSPEALDRNRPALKYWEECGGGFAIDNGAWTAHQQGKQWNEPAFRSMVWQVGARADWVVAPDIVGGGAASLRLSISWLPWLLALPSSVKILIAAQDGMTQCDLDTVVNKRVGIFVGGSTEWKLKTMPQWGELASAADCWLHVGRVNTPKRVHLCSFSGADSFDGSSPVAFPCTEGKIRRASKQRDLYAPNGRPSGARRK